MNVKKGDRVRLLRPRVHSNSIGTVDAVFSAGDGLPEPWAWVKWDHGGEGCPRLTDLEKVKSTGDSASVSAVH